jgi:O-antigen/teichoic acid export membrane protein
MQLTKHLDKGLWAIADKSLFAIYGVGFMFLVIRVLPKEELGVFVLIQNVFLILGHLSVCLGLSPLVKFIHEIKDRGALIAAAVYLQIGFITIAMILMWLVREPMGVALKSPAFAKLFYFVPLLFAAAFGKLLAVEILRSLFRIREVFWSDLTYFGSNLALIFFLTRSGAFDSARDQLMIQVVSFALSSAVSIGLCRRFVAWSWRPPRDVVLRLFHFGKFLLGSGINGQIYERSDVFIISAFVGPAEVAVYYSAKVFLRVYDMYRQVVNLLALPVFARLKAEGRLQDIRIVYEKGVFFSQVALLAVMAVLIFGANIFYDVFYQERYAGGEIFLRGLSLSGVFLAGLVFSDSVLSSIGRPDKSFRARGAATALSVALNYLLIRSFGSLGAVGASVLSTAFLAILMTAQAKTEINFTWVGVWQRHLDMANFFRKGLRTLARDIFAGK